MLHNAPPLKLEPIEIKDPQSDAFEFIPSASEVSAIPLGRRASSAPERPLRQKLPVPEQLPALEELPALTLAQPRRSWFGRLVYGIGSGLEWLFGAVCLMVGLAILAALPVFQFLSLGYLLEAGARVARSGKFRDGFLGVRLAARLGGMVLFSWLLMLPARFVAGMAEAAHIIDPGSQTARSWRFGLLILLLVTGLHIAAACARGGQLRYFLWPFNIIWLIRRALRGGYYSEMRDRAWDTLQALKLPHYFSLGFRGFVVGLAWLFVPVSLLALGHVHPLFGFLGALVLAYVLTYLPFLQMRMAVANRLADGFDRRSAKQEFCRAPWIWAVAFLMTMATAVPLYLLKLETVPTETAWLPSLFFIAFIFPARLLTGWALSWTRRSEVPRHWFFRWSGRLLLLPVVAIYIVILFFSQFTSWNGIFSLYEQHAFLVPAPFLGM